MSEYCKNCQKLQETLEQTQVQYEKVVEQNKSLQEELRNRGTDWAEKDFVRACNQRDRFLTKLKIAIKGLKKVTETGDIDDAVAALDEIGDSYEI